MEHGFEILVVWSLVTSSFVQCVIHLRTFWTVHNQRATEDLGVALNRRELSLGIKNIFRTLFDIVLAVIVTWGVYIVGQPGRMILYLLVSIATFVAVWYGLRFIRELGKQSLGYAAESKDRRDLRQDTRSDKQTVRSNEQDERSRRQDTQQGVLDDTSLILTRRGEFLSTAGINIDERRVGMDAEQSDMDKREHDVTEREGTQT